MAKITITIKAIPRDGETEIHVHSQYAPDGNPDKALMLLGKLAHVAVLNIISKATNTSDAWETTHRIIEPEEAFDFPESINLG